MAVSADGDTVVAGPPYFLEGGAEVAAAYVFKQDAEGNWTETRLTADAPTNGAYLGYSVAVSADGDTVVAGAPDFTEGGAWVARPMYSGRMPRGIGQKHD